MVPEECFKASSGLHNIAINKPSCLFVLDADLVVAHTDLTYSPASSDTGVKSKVSSFADVANFEHGL
jgi:hypothetical protein